MAAVKLNVVYIALIWSCDNNAALSAIVKHGETSNKVQHGTLRQGTLLSNILQNIYGGSNIINNTSVKSSLMNKLTDKHYKFNNTDNSETNTVANDILTKTSLSSINDVSKHQIILELETLIRNVVDRLSSAFLGRNSFDTVSVLGKIFLEDFGFVVAKIFGLILLNFASPELFSIVTSLSIKSLFGR